MIIEYLARGGSYVYHDFIHFCDNFNLPYKDLSFIRLFLKCREFRAILDYRFKQAGGIYRFLRLLTYHSHIILNCYISSKGEPIGEGLLVEHGFSTIINVESMGRYCHVYQQVTIGWRNGGQPLIGDNVMVCAGALVLGKIKIGDDVIIGAGSVVTKDIPSHSIVVGNPARIIKTRESRSECWKKV